MSDEAARPSIFGDDAEQYERARPGYPEALVDDLLTGETSRVLDVGCGTGKASRQFAARGCTVLGVEHDERMALVARRLGLEVEVARFEDWDTKGRRFDLVISGEAWHWIDPDIGHAKAADVLMPGGALAVFWNRPSFEDHVAERLITVYRPLEPHLIDDSTVLGTKGKAQVEKDTRSIRASGRFTEPEARTYSQSLRYSTAEFVDQVESHSDHRILPPNRLAALMRALDWAIDDLGGEIVVTFSTILVVAYVR